VYVHQFTRKHNLQQSRDASIHTIECLFFFHSIKVNLTLIVFFHAAIHAPPNPNLTTLGCEVMFSSKYLKDDDNRWSNDTSTVQQSDTVWVFEGDRNTFKQPTLTPAPDWIVLRVFRKSTNEHRHFCIPVPTALQIALLDLEYWANVVDPNPNSNRIARYLEKVRSDLWTELSPFSDGFRFGSQPETTRPWAVRMNHLFGHSFFGRKEYSQTCMANGWTPYTHEDPISYGKRLFLNRQSFLII
jgi:hypothetical protein